MNNKRIYAYENSDGTYRVEIISNMRDKKTGSESEIHTIAERIEIPRANVSIEAFPVEKEEKIEESTRNARSKRR